MKFNLAVFKKGKPIFWIIGAIVLFVLFYWLVSRGGSSTSSGGSSVVTTGPSDAQVAMQGQLALAGMQTQAGVTVATNQNNADVAIASLAAQTQNNQTQAAADVAKYTASLDAQTQTNYIEAQQTMLAQQVAGSIAQQTIQSQYGLESGRIAAQSVLDQANVQAAMFGKQLDTNAAMFAAQLHSADFQSLVAQVPNVKKNDRDNMLALLTAADTGGALTFYDPGHSNINYVPGNPTMVN